ncbi:MAG: 6-phosphogluconolactonase [Ignavibacteriales bacterium]|nr:MAG: 6-phosphogluconolactonase [Ignavibacteriales bacterium]
MKLLVFKNIEELSADFCNKLVQLTNGNDKLFLALSGGSTPRIIFNTLVEDFRKKIDWNKIHFFWGDERCVSLDHPESNYGMAKEYLLNHIDIPEENIHRIRGENNPADEAERYSDEIKNFLPEVKGFPQFDIVMLGLGEDGHTASIFPDQSELLSSGKICEVAVHPTTKQKRITITGNVINNSKRIFFIMTGMNKALILSQIMNKEDDYNKYPAAHIKPANGLLEWYLNIEEDPRDLFKGNFNSK